MTCTEFLGKLTDYFDGQISPELLDEVRAHSSSCHHCEVVLDTTRQTIAVYRDNELCELSPELQERLHTSIMLKCRQAMVQPAPENRSGRGADISRSLTDAETDAKAR